MGQWTQGLALTSGRSSLSMTLALESNIIASTVAWKACQKSGLRLPCCINCTNLTFTGLLQFHKPLRSVLSNTASAQSAPEELSP